eukprot:9365228-Pyramimonas_sp.AAC.1
MSFWASWRPREGPRGALGGPGRSRGLFWGPPRLKRDLERLGIGPGAPRMIISCSRILSARSRAAPERRGTAASPDVL